MKQINQRQAHDALELLEEMILCSDPAKCGGIVERAKELLKEVSMRQRRSYKRWVYGRDGRGFRAGDWVYLGMQKMHVFQICIDDQTFQEVGRSSWHAAKLAVKVSPSVASTEELAEMGQYVLDVETERMGATQ